MIVGRLRVTPAVWLDLSPSDAATGPEGEAASRRCVAHLDWCLDFAEMR